MNPVQETQPLTGGYTFSPASQKTVWNVQTRIREIDMALHPSVKSQFGEIRTFTYSTLAGCCGFSRD